jgi:putative endonuclease
MLDKRKELGRTTEDEACVYLRGLGYRIIERNWRSPFGELDIIARDGDSLVIVEVKARTGSTFGGPEGALSAAKRERIVTATRAYLAASDAQLPLRFDLVAVEGDRVTLYRDAFRLEEGCSLGF